MLKIASILNHIKSGIENELERYKVIDHEHIFDEKTGVKLHIYDDWFKLTRDGVEIATMRDFDTNIEQPIIWEIKRLITPNGVIEEKEAEFMSSIKERREMLSAHFEVPEPIVDAFTSDDEEEYTG